MKETTLIKTYNFIENEKDEINNVEGCEINWTEDEKNPTLKITTKKKKRGKVKETVSITKKVDSFLIYLMLKILTLIKN